LFKEAKFNQLPQIAFEPEKENNKREAVNEKDL
jgi:hypothetical protein